MNVDRIQFIAWHSGYVDGMLSMLEDDQKLKFADDLEYYLFLYDSLNKILKELKQPQITKHDVDMLLKIPTWKENIIPTLNKVFLNGNY